MKITLRATASFLFTSAVLTASYAGRAEDNRSDALEDIKVVRIGTYYGEDSSYALQLNFDLPLTDATRLNVGGAYIRATGDLENIDSYQANLDVEHRIGNWGFALGGIYRNDDTIITTAGVRGRAYYSTDQLNAGVRLGRSRIEASYDLGTILSRYVDGTQSDYSTEYGGDLRYSFGVIALYASGVDYEYDEPLSSLAPRRNGVPIPVNGNQIGDIQDRLARLRARLGTVNFAALRIATNLLDYSLVVGGDYQIGEQVINVELARQRVAIDAVDIDSIDVGWTIPCWETADLELRVGSAKVHGSDSLFYGGLNFTLYR